MKSRLAILAILVVAAFLRLWKLNAFGFNSDEAVYAGQAAAIAGDAALSGIFPIFRAHPLLHQFLLALIYLAGVTDLTARLLSVAIGLATIVVVYLLGRLLYGPRAGFLAALFMALMPYHVMVSRQVLLDGTLVFCATLTLYLLANYAQTGRSIWLLGAGVGLGLTFLAKETGIILLGAVFAFLALSPEIRMRLPQLGLSLGLMLVVMLPFPASLLISGRSVAGQSYLVWQLLRRPNHPWDFYATHVPQVIGYLVIILALLGLWLARRDRSWRERLLLLWIVVPILFFQLWPTKGFQYLLPIAPALSILAARTLASLSAAASSSAQRSSAVSRMLTVVLTVVVALTLTASSWARIQPASTGTFLAGTGGLPGGREAGIWILENVPEGASFLTIGPSMANVIQFYGHRKARGLSISANPLRRNPAYEPVVNPDLQIRLGEIHYLVWDSFSAGRSPFFSERLLRLAEQFGANVVHTESVTLPAEGGGTVEQPLIVIYEVRL